MAEPENPEDARPKGRPYPGMAVWNGKPRLTDEELEARQAGGKLTMDRKFQNMDSYLKLEKKMAFNRIDGITEKPKSEGLFMRMKKTKPEMSGELKYRTKLKKSTSSLLADINMFSGTDVDGNRKRVRHLEKTNDWFEEQKKPLGGLVKKSLNSISCPNFLEFAREEVPPPGSMRVHHPRRLKPALFPKKERLFASSLSEDDDALLKEYHKLNPPIKRVSTFNKGKIGAAFAGATDL